MKTLFLAVSLFASFSYAETPQTPICITVYTGDVEFASTALRAAAEQKNLFEVKSFKLNREGGQVVILIEGADAGGSVLNLEVRMKQDCGTGEAVVLSITGPTVLI